MLTAKGPPSRNSVSTSRRQTSDRPLTGFRQRFDRYLTGFGIVCVLGSMQGEDNSLAGEDNSLAGEDHLLPRGPRPPPMWGSRVGFMGVKEHEFPRNEMGIVETGS